MKPDLLGKTLLAMCGACALSACETPSDRIATREDHLAAAGFAFKPADTPSLQAMLNRLPQHQFLRRVHDGKTFYVYADETVCGCLYVGDEFAFYRYRQSRQQDAYQRASQLGALNYQDNTWSWGPWMPGWNGWNPAWGNWDPGMMGPVGW
ncbi:hypothetical protein [Acidomonas methanolica]|uniref:Lipoprotein n=1 Tax=Acidomonas methanolica NBRC 104435 TaxID=1231351 RepID=A0A023D6K3_ACIMT|nr:hypothetical protein [Acidomonas methanolica]TCS24063.1 hypothetical protein EDC31_12620 [Acidomonas methanolica]GAJ29782.1 hypothetical protein Amme_078_014 [Acidomonas methanolica NBRC 104435]GEL00112.1 hypothetical protein AME01nite_26100 [Acidomonas methanolica NBRC 104435]